MKKLFSVLAVGAFLLFAASMAYADWSVTVTWTRSVGPNLDYEECQLDTVVECTVQETDPTTCTFIVTALAGQEVLIRSYNIQGASVDYVIGTLLAVPAPATNGSLTIVYVP